MSRNLIISFLFIFIASPIQAQESTDNAPIHQLLSSLVKVNTVYSKTVSGIEGHKGLVSYERHGAGVIIDPSGIIVTNTHIIKNAPHVLVTLANGKTFEAHILFSSSSDFSFIKIFSIHPLRAMSWANSSLAQLGEKITAVGSPENHNPNILHGKIINLIKNKSTDETELLEMNLPLYQGDSGGPILDNKGHLLGLIMGKPKSQKHQSYAIASNKIKREFLNRHFLKKTSHEKLRKNRNLENINKISGKYKQNMP